MPDPITTAWIRNKSDELAVAAGCRFEPLRGAYAIYWIERYCRLYQGEEAGRPLLLHGCHECGTYGLPPAHELPDWNEDEPDNAAIAACLERARRYAACVAAGHRVDWQYECLMRLFGWVKFSPRWNREVRRFRRGSLWVPKKNKKSPTLAAIGLFLLAGDGESGQCVFLAAKDGTQARKVAGEHAVQMLDQSPELKAECKLNQNTMRISHGPTRSFLEPLSSSNERTKEAKEGYNGSVLVDETHVVDADFMAILEGAGISRSEPLHLEFSTAGNNPDGYGKLQYDKAVRVQAGEYEDETLFVAIYAAPQDLTESQLAADPEKFIRLANPALGHTVDLTEALAHYTRSKASITDLAKFMMYRLNVWQKSTNPAIRLSDWRKCAQLFKLEEMAGRPCWAGLDLAKTRALTALVFCWPWEEGYRIWPYFFMPEVSAREMDHKVPYLGWERSKHLIFTPGESCDYAFVRHEFKKACAQFDVRQLIYDPWQAEQTTQEMEQGVVVNGKTIEEGTGVPRFEFKQTIGNYAEPTKEFEKLIVDGHFWHPDSPVLNWQAGHCQFWTNANGDKRPIKPKHGDHKSIDGIVAAIMALAGAMKSAGGNPSEFYENNDIELA